MQCTNNLKQLAMGCLNHESAQKFLPTGGWGSGWMGDPDQGFGKSQPGCWLFSILPYIEQDALLNVAAGSPGWPTSAAKRAKMAQTMRVPLATFFCPTRRRPLARPAVPGGTWYNVNPIASGDVAGFCDYAANWGTTAACVPNRVNKTYATVSDSDFPPLSKSTGVVAPTHSRRDERHCRRRFEHLPLR